MWEVFIPQKRNKQGHSYGFVRFKGVEDRDRLERRLDNNIYIQRMKLFVNKPKFQRGGNKVAESPVGMNSRTATKTMEPAAPKQTTHQVPMPTKLKSYVEAVKYRNQEWREIQDPMSGIVVREVNAENINIQMTKEKTKWLDNAWVGRLKNKGMFDRVDEEVRGVFGLEVKVAYWGDDMVILYDLDEETANDFNHKEHLHGGTPFSPLQRWTLAMMPSYHLTWLHIWGLPLLAWDAETFASIVSVCGELVELDGVTEDRLRVDIARVLVRTAEKPLIARKVSVMVDGVQYLLDLREELGSGWGRRSREEVEERFPPSPFSTAIADSDVEPNTHVSHDFSLGRLSGSPIGGSSTWSSSGMAERRRRRRTTGSYPGCRGIETTTRAEVSPQRCHVPLSAPGGLTPPDVGQKGCNGPLCLDMHGGGMADPRTFCPNQQRKPFLEVDVEDKVQPAFEKTNNLWALKDEPSVISLETSLVVKHGSNLTCSYQRDFAALEGGISDQTLGLITKSPITNGFKPSSTLMVYVRRKEWGAANHKAHVNLSPDSCHNGTEPKPRNLTTENSLTDDMEGRDLHTSDPDGLTPKQHCTSHSPAPNSSFNKVYFENEEVLHMEIARDLGVSYAENNNSKDNVMNEDNISSCFTTPARVMGMKQIDS